MDRQVQLEGSPGDAAVDGVVDQLQHGIDGGPVVGEQGRRELWVDPLPDDAAGRHGRGSVGGCHALSGAV